MKDNWRYNEPYFLNGKDAMFEILNIYFEKYKDYLDYNLKDDKDFKESNLIKYGVWDKKKYKTKKQKCYKEFLDRREQCCKKIEDMINIDLSEEKITDSFLCEYALFELCRLYKTIDYDKYVLLFLGW